MHLLAQFAATVTVVSRISSSSACRTWSVLTGSAVTVVSVEGPVTTVEPSPRVTPAAGPVV
ncbi:hypothetical protein PF005_g26111 [Phytophthora fragariae]|uniref:Uncharacterized protein n=1 Tax=Phytophthora fragariae TaxID=53985 RepID=A0A6A3E404_9STRA|nr:hypothetical protein PF003_g40797 [Phytophthora fragariae]KAE8882889.1 hypothetical protein PF003_g33040 [Phytophthora fragariae]KAE8924548.1 hypothetical protein PF009_g25228 [Phytophthora fragariae]KAE8973431.1 hypothetical protein PF011_g25259 [Phytophthora fragariae]KAE9095843.1 hypothetical protein PF007_g17235 [Phytophthora fragariae]